MYVELKRSKVLISILAILHCFALLAIYLTDLPVGLKWLMTFLIVVSAGYHWQKYVWQAGRSTIKSLWQQGGQWHLQMANRRVFSVDLLDNAYVTPWLVILRFKKSVHRRIYTAVICRDSLDNQRFKQLRVAIQQAIR